MKYVDGEQNIEEDHDKDNTKEPKLNDINKESIIEEKQHLQQSNNGLFTFLTYGELILFDLYIIADSFI